MVLKESDWPDLNLSFFFKSVEPKLLELFSFVNKEGQVEKSGPEH